MAILKPMEALGPADIAELVADSVAEDRTLDYKDQLSGNTDQDHKELLADISALANTLGGYMVFGMAEERDGEGRPTGIPLQVRGLPGNLDAEMLRLEAMARTGIDPRVPRLRFRTVPGGASGSVLVCWVPRTGRRRTWSRSRATRGSMLAARAASTRWM
jgi:hypothetical protein